MASRWVAAPCLHGADEEDKRFAGFRVGNRVAFFFAFLCGMIHRKWCHTIEWIGLQMHYEGRRRIGSSVVHVKLAFSWPGAWWKGTRNRPGRFRCSRNERLWSQHVAFRRTTPMNDDTVRRIYGSKGNLPVELCVVPGGWGRVVGWNLISFQFGFGLSLMPHMLLILWLCFPVSPVASSSARNRSRW